ncbi:MAG: hypothetical protein NC217_03120 [Muribaculaceae bacterium]|nr:hypothetical protein [Muribaculaceae bacterium]
MKKLALKFVLCMVAVLCVASMTSCGKKDKNALLKTVPADAAIVVLADGNEAWNQLGITVEDDDVSFGDELNKFIKAADIDKKDVKKAKEVLNVANMTKKSVTFFMFDDDAWITFFVDDQDKFIKAIEDLPDSKESFDEEDGIMVSQSIAIKDDQVWIFAPIKSDDDEIDLKQVKKFADLDSEDRFNEKFETLTEEFCREDVSFGYFMNLEEMSLSMHKSDQGPFNMAQSILFDGSKYVVGIGRITDKQVSLEVRILNSKLQPATFNLPMAKIDANGMAHIDGSAPILFATAINPKMIEAVQSLLEKNDLISSADNVMLNEFKCLDGTIACSMSNLNDYAFSIQFDSANTAKENGQEMVNALAGELWGSSIPFTVSNSSNTLILRSKGATATSGGKVPSALVGQYLGIYVDFKKTDKTLKGLDLSKLGTMYATVGPDGKGIKLTAVWDINAPFRTILKLIREVSTLGSSDVEVIGLEDFYNSLVPQSNYDYEMVDSTAYVYDNYGYYDDPYEVVGETVAVEEW